ncbi:MAG: Lrp/AsnC family transcriptional regulator [Rhodospirillales bacterium]
MDQRDRRLIELLQEDSRISNADLADAVGMSTSACWRRVRALEEQGAIAGYGAKVSAAALGLDFHAIVQVHLTRHGRQQLDDFIRAVTLRREVCACYATAGPADYYLRVLCRDLAAYNAFLEDFLFRLPAVQSAQTHLILREIKESAGLLP